MATIMIKVNDVSYVVYVIQIGGGRFSAHPLDRPELESIGSTHDEAVALLREKLENE